MMKRKTRKHLSSTEIENNGKYKKNGYINKNKKII